jgi:hypothetical protein
MGRFRQAAGPPVSPIEEDDMPEVEVNQRFLCGGAALFGVGGLLCASGASLCIGAVVDATRRWVGQLDEPPSRRARRRWSQVRAATSAGVDAWRHDGPPATPGEHTAHRTRPVSV